MALADEIRRRRASLGLTLEELAATSGVSKTYLWELENDSGEVKRPSANLLLKIANALKTTIGELLELPTVRINKQAISIPESLNDFAKRMKKFDEPISKRELYDLAAMRFRGGHPTTFEGWRDLYYVLKRTSAEKSS